MRPEVVALALTASVFTALARSPTSCRGVAPAQNGLGSTSSSGSFIGRCGSSDRQHVLGFAFQVAALQVRSLSLVQPVIATERLIVFAIIALRHRHGVPRDWLAALGMAIALGTFLALARPAGGHDHASGSSGCGRISTFAVAACWLHGLCARSTWARAARPPGGAAWHRAAAGFGFVAAVIKELSPHFARGPVAVFSSWSPWSSFSGPARCSWPPTPSRRHHLPRHRRV